MTAVASPPSVQSGPRLGWYSAGNSGQGALTSMSADDVSRMFMPRKNLQRTNSSSSLASSSSSSSTATISATPSHSNAGQGSNVESGTWSSKKKSSRGIWPSSKSEPVSGVTNARSQAVSASPSGPTASSAMSAIHQPSPVVPSQHMLQSPQTNGVRPGAGQASNDPPAILTLLPMNGTFERKQINVPFLPDLLRIGRQTNAKTVPTPVNGFFDSKVLSRQHAEIWADRNGKIWIRDIKSSNGTFVNGQRLSPENKESEPHELREHDTLELGIDIVSEDQKSIVHHKVSAKVEHAGIYGSNPSILDLNFGDIDPTARGGLLPSPLSQPVQMRGRQGSSASMGSSRSSQSAADNHLNLLHQQRQMNYWLSPITIEQVVKKLSTEMKQAKAQAQDLDQTGGFLNSLIAQDGMEKERHKPSHIESQSHHGPRQANGRPKMPKIDHLSRFSEPPAPPPQQPLPEKPDALPRHSPSDQVASHSPLRRSDTEKPKPSGAGGSPLTREPSQIITLVEALAAAKKEIDSQGARVKELEDMLLQERTARESAEERARKLELSPIKDFNNDSEIEAAFEPPPEQDEKATTGDGEENQTLVPEHPITTDKLEQPNEKEADSQPSVSTADNLQKRLEAMVAEMDVMKQQLNEYKQRAETAEEEKVDARKTLAQMIEKYRSERAETTETTSKENSLEKGVDGALASGPDGTISSEKLDSHAQADKLVPPNNIKELESAVTAFANQRHRSNVMGPSAPYASMIGVVLLGVGIMAYLNNWQKIDK